MTELGELQILEGPIEAAPSLEDFLRQLGRPTLLHITGRDSSRCRALATLLHGNEPSGVIAVHRWLLQRQPPAVNLLILIGAVNTALKPPHFFYRQLPGRRDLNRCFREPFDDEEGRVAQGFLAALQRERPECLVDIHNTSGFGPSFCIAIADDARHRALASMFSHRFVVNHLRLGALMEYSEGQVPTVTVECGGSLDPAAHECAYQGLLRYTSHTDLLAEIVPQEEIEVLTHPVRVELAADATLAFHRSPMPGFDLTLPPDIEHLNFSILDTEQPLGWLGPRGLAIFRVRGPNGRDLTHALLRDDQGQLHPAQPLKAFMITPNPAIAKSDCLFYAVTAKGQPLF